MVHFPTRKQDDNGNDLSMLAVKINAWEKVQGFFRSICKLRAAVALVLFESVFGFGLCHRDDDDGVKRSEW